MRAALLVVFFASLAYADVFTLNDGTKVEGTLVGAVDDAYMVKLADGTTKRLLKSDVKSRVEKPVEAPKETPPPVKVETTKGPELTADERMALLKKMARDGLSLRARLVVGARELVTWTPLKVEGGYAISSQPKKLELDTATFLDRNVDEIAQELWDKRAKGADERFRALKAVSAAVCWADAEVLSVAPAGNDREAVIEWKSIVLRGKTRIRFSEAEAFKAKTTVKLPVALLVRQEEGAQFLAGQMGDSVSVWPVDFVALAAEVGNNAKTPRTVAADLALRVGERTVGDAVRNWYTLRMRIQCPACKGSRKCPCADCKGRGGCMKDFISVTGVGGGAVWVPCPICKGSGCHTCAQCKDGLDEYILKDSLKRFGTYGKPLGGFLLEGQKIVMEADGKGATVTTWIRPKKDDQPVSETLHWSIDEKTNTWKPSP
jgi:hypothetical protein